VILVGEQKPQRLEVPLEKPTGLALIHNDGTLVVADAASKNLWAFRIKQDGKLDAGEKYYSLRVRKSDTSAETTAVIADTRDRIYAATKEGLQVFDPTGRLCGVLMIPTTDPILSMNFEGEKLERLRIVTANEGYVRKVIANVPPPMPKKK
jgi:enterochelin esterase family protein